MRKKSLLSLAFVLALSYNVYAQSDSEAKSEQKGNFFFSVGLSDGIFSSGPIIPFSNFEIKKLRAGIIGGYYELPKGPGNVFFGLELGYSSGSKFGGKGDVDFIPFDLTAAYVFPLTSFFYLGPRVKVGGLGLLGPDWNRAVFVAGAKLEAELRFTGFPIGLFVAGGIDAFPTAPEFATLPVVEAGLRYPRGKFKRSGSSDTAKNKEPAKTDTGASKDSSSGQNAALVAAAPAASTPSTAAPAAPPPSAAAPAALAPAPAASTPAAQAPAPVAAPPAAPPPSAAAPAALAPAPAASTPAAPAPVIAPPITGATQDQDKSIILEDGRRGILSSIYFEPDTAVLIESYRPVLDAVGRQLSADPGLKLLIRAYAADFGTAGGRYIVSVNRARFSRDFFTAQYGISANRFNIEAYGADRSPINATSDWKSHRCVELILFRE